MICRHKLYHFTVANTRFTAPLTRRGKTKFATIKWYNLCRQIIQSQTCYPLIFVLELSLQLKHIQVQICNISEHVTQYCTNMRQCLQISNVSSSNGTFQRKKLTKMFEFEEILQLKSVEISSDWGEHEITLYKLSSTHLRLSSTWVRIFIDISDPKYFQNRLKYLFMLCIG